MNPQRQLVTPAIVLVLFLAFIAPTNAQTRGRAQAQPVPTADDLEVGTLVEVEGQIVGGVLVATQIEVYPEADTEEVLEAMIEALDLEAGSLTVLGWTVMLNEDAKLRDADKLPLELSELEVGQIAKSKGMRGEDGIFHARRVRVQDPKPDETADVKVEALIEEADPAKKTMTVFGMKVAYSPRTEFKAGS